MVRMRQQGCDLVCFIQFPDKEIKDILSGDCLGFRLFEGFKQPRNLYGRHAINFVRSTTANSNYLHVA
jgi:hypothetical protein